MGNENTKSSQQQSKEEIEAALRRQQAMFERRFQQLLREQKQEQDRNKNDEIEKALEALRTEKEKYETKCKDLQNQVRLQTQNSHNFGQFTNIQESLQNRSPIYPNLENLNHVSVPRRTNSPLGMHSSTTANIQPRFAPTAPTAPPEAAAAAPAFPTWRIQASSSRNSEENNFQTSCVSCNKRFMNQVFQCKNKHNSCKNCKLAQASCGVCRLEITGSRNFALETRLATGRSDNSDQKQPCPNSIDGCCLSFKAQEMPAHLKECLFMDILCPVTCNRLSMCTWRGKITQLQHHFELHHPEHCGAAVDKEMALLNYKDDAHLVYFVTLGAYKFLVHVKVDSSEKVILMAAQMFGPQRTADKWSYQIHVYNKASPRRKYQYNGVCRSSAVDADDIFAEGNCAILHTTHANSFAGNDKLTYKFYLKQIFNKGDDKK